MPQVLPVASLVKRTVIEAAAQNSFLFKLLCEGQYLVPLLTGVLYLQLVMKLTETRMNNLRSIKNRRHMKCWFPVLYTSVRHTIIITKKRSSPCRRKKGPTVGCTALKVTRTWMELEQATGVRTFYRIVALYLALDPARNIFEVSPNI